MQYEVRMKELALEDRRIAIREQETDLLVKDDFAHQRINIRRFSCLTCFYRVVRYFLVRVASLQRTVFWHGIYRKSATEACRRLRID